MDKVVFKVNGIKNNTEKQQIKNALDKIEGIQEVAIDQNRNRVEVQYNPPASEVEIMDCIEDTGHNVEL